MSRIQGLKACHACHRAKRKCGKQTPLCLRCRKRGIECTYPASKPTCFVLCGDFNVNDENDLSFQDTSILPYSDAAVPSWPTGIEITGANDDTLSLDVELQGLAGTDMSAVRCHSLTGWLTAPGSCEADSFPQPEGITLRSDDLKRHISRINRWLHQWVDTGSNPFIHQRLYKTRFPRCIQDAYLALSCYLKQTTSNEQVVTQIIEDRATQLLQDYAVPTSESRQEHDGRVANSLDILEQIARVQALLIYQYLGLYDGDIRMRYLAESLIPELYSWVQELFDQYSKTACLGSTLTSSAARDQTFSVSLHAPSPDNIAWYDWILAETIRRTVIVACGVQALYIVLQQGGKIPCQGNIMYTPHKGMWEADSSLAWRKQCSETDITLVQTADTKQVFAKLGPESVDDFAILVLEIRNGIERVERWETRVEG
jgi:hypothetical protein